MAITNKRGISDLVTTVLLVLITIVAVGILYASVMPLIKTNIEKTKQCNDVAMEVVTEGGYTCYLDNGEVEVQVSRGPSDVELYGIQIQLSGGGISKTFNIYNGTTSNNIKLLDGNYDEELELPGKNEALTYVIKSGLSDFEKVAVAPILKIGKKEEMCSILSSVSLSECA